MEVMVLLRARLTLAAVITLAILVSVSSVSANTTYEFEPGVHCIEVCGQSFEVETAVTIELTFDFVDDYRVAGSITVLDPVGSGWVKLTWLDPAVVVVDTIIEAYLDFDYRSSETGHAERSRPPRYGPTLRAEPPLD
jgi:hypothetical protein